MNHEATYRYVRRDAIRRTTINGDSNSQESSAMLAHRDKPEQRHTHPKSILVHRTLLLTLFNPRRADMKFVLPN